MWAVDLEGGNNESGFEHNMTHSAFNISIKLTETGFEHVYEVIIEGCVCVNSQLGLSNKYISQTQKLFSWFNL